LICGHPRKSAASFGHFSTAEGRGERRGMKDQGIGQLSLRPLRSLRWRLTNANHFLFLFVFIREIRGPVFTRFFDLRSSVQICGQLLSLLYRRGRGERRGMKDQGIGQLSLRPLRSLRWRLTNATIFYFYSCSFAKFAARFSPGFLICGHPRKSAASFCHLTNANHSLFLFVFIREIRGQVFNLRAVFR
jgi:hypothetical protein